MKALINSTATKSGDYYKATIKVFLNESGKFNAYHSKDMFITRKVALKYAEQWAHECRLVGYVTQA